MKQAKVINASSRKNDVVVILSDGSEFFYPQTQIKGILKGIETDNQLPAGCLGFLDLIGNTVTGDWEPIKAGQKKVLDAEHKLVTDGASTVLEVLRKGKPVTLQIGDTAEAGDEYVYTKDGTRRNGLLNFHKTFTAADYDSLIGRANLKAAMAKLNATVQTTVDFTAASAALPSYEDELANATDTEI